jgi:cell division transport system permease protein
MGEVGIGLRRNLLMTLATVVTVTVSLALLGVGLLISTQVDLARTILYQEVEVSIFLLDSVTEQQRADFEEELRNNPEVEDVIYESKELAYEHAQQIFADDEAILDSIDANDLPASFRVSLQDPENFNVVRSQYIEYPGVDEVVDQRDTLDRSRPSPGVTRPAS